MGEGLYFVGVIIDVCGLLVVVCGLVEWVMV